MTLDEYQTAAMLTRPAFPTLDHGVVELCAEAGEVASLVKRRIYKHRHQIEAESAFNEKLAEELGDVLWCVAYLAQQQELSLSSIAAGNVDKLTRRWGGLLA